MREKFSILILYIKNSLLMFSNRAILNDFFFPEKSNSLQKNSEKIVFFSIIWVKNFNYKINFCIFEEQTFKFEDMLF